MDRGIGLLQESDSGDHGVDNEVEALGAGDSDLEEHGRLVWSDEHGEVVEFENADGIAVGVKHGVVCNPVAPSARKDHGVHDPSYLEVASRGSSGVSGLLHLGAACVSRVGLAMFEVVQLALPEVRDASAAPQPCLGRDVLTMCEVGQVGRPAVPVPPGQVMGLTPPGDGPDTRRPDDHSQGRPSRCADAWAIHWSARGQALLAA